MLIYPPTFIPPELLEPVVISAAEKTWVRNQLKNHMVENKGYRLHELVNFIQQQIRTLYPTRRYYNNGTIRGIILELDQEWGWHPEVEELVE